MNAAVQRANLALIDDNNLTRLDIADELCAQRIQCARLGREDDRTVLALTHAQRTHAARIAGCDELAGRHDDDGVRADDLLHGLDDRRLDGRGNQALAHDGIDQCLGVRGRAEDTSAHLHLTAQLGCVD